ncbi:hypothetical protein KI688_006520 [Linnemannia hyalina]|uniref:Coth-domain-containing protein n=1 Tax=Linnemannia hyalina TaxID=64524 RepID=A0A9P7XL96_9FUNG|nr:hypothetical protein KI688_006520 [Linnemannia hyalina]
MVLNFNVIGLREVDVDEFGVMINGKVTKLRTSKEAYPLWSANVAGIDAPLEYQYVRLSKGGEVHKESKPRKLPVGAVHTPNDFFDRPDTLHKLPALPQVFENKLEQNSPFFREGYIGNLFVEGDPKAWSVINSGGGKWWEPKPVNVKVHYFGANDNVKISNVKLKLSGGQTRSYSKLPYKFQFPKGQSLLDISVLKLRSAETDPTMMREKLYIDILNTLGVPAPQTAYVRLFFNQKPVGLYVAQEVMKKHWLTTVLHPKHNGTRKTGSLWKMGADNDQQASLLWKGPTTASYSFGHIYKSLLPGNNPKNDLMRDLIKLMADIKSFDPKKEKDPIGYWEKRLDLDVFLKAMAMEYLTGFWDGYWTSGSNYQMYNNPATGLWTWLPIDYDDTFGSSYSGEPGSYRKFRMQHESPLVKKLILESPQIRARFEAILKDTVSYVFKPQALMPRISAYRDMILNDVKWDRSLPRLNKGETEGFTVEDLSKGVADGEKGKWGLKRWIVKRTEGVEKDLKFKVLPGTPSKVQPHVMTKLQSAYGIPAKEETSPASMGDENRDTVANGDDTVGGGDMEGDTSIQRDSASSSSIGHQADKTKNSAMSLRSEWATFIAALALIALTL